MTAKPLFSAALILGLLSAVGPFAIDMYLPAMPSIAASLQADVASTQFTLMAFFIAFGLGQLFYGPWSDQSGRKAPLYAGLVLFSIASIGCALAPTIGWLIACRFVQGLGAAVLMVLPRAVIRDMHTGAKATQLMALVMLVISISPLLAPMAGSGLLMLGDWRLIFWVLSFAAALGLILTALALPETLSPTKRVQVNLGFLWVGCKRLFGDPIFVGLTFIGGFGFASFMVFIANAAFVYSVQFGLSTTQFSLAFAVNAIGFFAASQAAGPLAAKKGILSLINWAALSFASLAIALLLIAMAGFATLPIIVAGLFCSNACLGLLIPTTMVMALDAHGEIAGLASSLGGTLQAVTAGVMIVISGLFFDGTAVPMIATITACAVLSLLVALFTLRAIRRKAAVVSGTA